MSRTTTAVKDRYNKKAYKAFNVRLKPELFNRVEGYCKNNNLSRSQFLSIAINLLSPLEDAPNQ